MFTSRFLLVLLAALFGAAPVVAFAEQGSHQISIPAGSLADALEKLGDQSGVQILYEPAVAKGVKVAAVNGKLTVSAALSRLLANTGLRVDAVNEKTVVLKRAWEGTTSSVTQMADLRLPRVEIDRAGVSEDQRKADSLSTSDDKPREVMVTGTRIRGLLSEQSMQPVLTITGEDIERYGISSLGELFRYVPQVTGFEQGQEIQSTGALGAMSIGVTSNRITATLRGAPVGGTLLLINGRRVPKTGQSSGFDGYDLGGIPLSAVQRVDVLLDGASAIYGADAVGGVINVILKKRYRGTEARVAFENTFESDVSVKTVTLTHGFSAGKLSALASASWEEANSMMWRDRWFLNSFDRSFLGGPNLVQIFFRSYGYSGPGVISSVSGNLPGLSTNIAPIPAGSDGVNLTVEDFANAGPLPEVFDFGEFARYSSPYERKNATVNIEYEFGRAFSAFADVRWGESRTWSSSTLLNAHDHTVPAGAPGNPFGVDIQVQKFFFDVPAPIRRAVTENRGITAGFRGEILEGWRYETAMNDVRSLPDVATRGGGRSRLDTALLADAFAGSNPPILLYDSTSGISPNSPGTLEALLIEGVDAEHSRTRTYDFSAEGPVFALPAGDVRMSVGMEYRDENVEFPYPESSLSIQSNDRYNSGYFAEVRVPLVSDRQGWPLLNRLEASVAVRHDRYSDFPETTNPRYGLLYRPVEWLMLRGSYGQGYKVPTLVQLYQPTVQSSTFFLPGSYFDAERGGETIDGVQGIAVIFKGNPDLRPERSENITVGAVLDVPFAEGLSLSFDYYDTQYLDRVASLGSLTDRIVLFPETVIRGPNLPGDPPGWPGPIIGYESVAFNTAVNHVSGYDISVKYHRPSEWGDWTLQATGSQTTRNETRSAPNLPPIDLGSHLPLQVIGSLFLQRGAFSTGALCNYRAASFGSTVSEPFIPSAIRWDWQGSYDFSRSGWSAAHGSSWWSRALADTRINVTIFNVFDNVPPLQEGAFLPDNTVVDSRLRRYAIHLTKRF